jgi:hypothetical protein
VIDGLPSKLKRVNSLVFVFIDASILESVYMSGVCTMVFMNLNSYKRQLRMLAILSFVCVLSNIGGKTELDPDTRAGFETPPSEQDIQEMARTLATRRMSENFVPSLKSRESADFLLTPAILMQEAITEGVVLTYPSE